MSQAMFQVPTEDFNVGPFAAGERTVNPHDVARLNADGNLIPQSRTFELVRVPLSVDILHERPWLLDSEISTIDGDLAGLSSIFMKPVIPLDLKEGTKSKKKLFKLSQMRHVLNKKLTTDGTLEAISSMTVHTHFLNVFRVGPPTIEIKTVSVPYTLRKSKAQRRCFGFVPMGKSQRFHATEQTLALIPNNPLKSRSPNVPSLLARVRIPLAM